MFLGVAETHGVRRPGKARSVTRVGVVVLAWVAAIAGVLASAWVSPYWLFAAVPVTLLGLLGTWDLLQPRHSVLRNYPVLGHAPFLLEKIRPEVQQYFVER